jgi:hypothetical protein
LLSVRTSYVTGTGIIEEGIARYARERTNTVIQEDITTVIKGLTILIVTILYTKKP